jgi:hypothetical protein
MSKQTKFNAGKICYGAQIRILVFLYPGENCVLSRDESKAYFVFRFTMCDRDRMQEIGRFTVLGAMIEDGIISEQRLHAALWHTLGQIRGMA